MPEATETRAKPASINRRIRGLFRENPMVALTKLVIRYSLRLPPDTEITARIREIRNDARDPMDIRCERVKRPGGVLYHYTFWPANTVLPSADEKIPY
jgi:hypothetical protein